MLFLNTMMRQQALTEQLKRQLFAAIAKTMEQEKITQAEVARRIGAERRNINRLMRGKIPVSIDFLLKIAESIGLEVELKARLRKQEKLHRTPEEASVTAPRKPRI